MVRNSAKVRPDRRAVEVVGGVRQGRGRQAGRDLDHPVLHLAVRPHQDHQRPTRPERHEFDMPHRAVALGRQHQPGGGGQARQHGRRIGQRVLQRPARVPRAARPIRSRSSSLRSPNCSRPSTNRRMPRSVGRRPAEVWGGEQQPGLGQVGHDVADRGRRHRDRQEAAGERAASHRLTGLHELLDDLAQDGSAARIQARGQVRTVETKGHVIHMATKLGMRMRRVKSGDRLIGTVERGRVAAWKWRTLVSEFERGWQAALEAAKAWHEGQGQADPGAGGAVALPQIARAAGRDPSAGGRSAPDAHAGGDGLTRRLIRPLAWSRRGS